MNQITIYFCLLQMLGQVGLVHSVHIDENKVKLFFRGHSVGITVATKALEKVGNALLLHIDI